MKRRTPKMAEESKLSKGAMKAFNRGVGKTPAEMARIKAKFKQLSSRKKNVLTRKGVKK